MQSLSTYKKLSTEFYDLELEGKNYEIIAFYLNQAIIANGPILEPMCGTGRFLIPIANAGFDIEGFDASAYMLEALKKKWSLNSSPNISQLFVQNFKNNKKYKLIFVPFGSWGLIIDIEQSKKSISNLFDHLEIGGKFFLEIETVASAPKLQNIWSRGILVRPNGSYIAINTLPTYDKKSQIYNAFCRYESIINNQIEDIEEEDFQMYLYNFNELDRFLETLGFSKINKYQDYKLTPVSDPNTPIIIYECLK